MVCADVWAGALTIQQDTGWWRKQEELGTAGSRQKEGIFCSPGARLLRGKCMSLAWSRELRLTSAVCADNHAARILLRRSGSRGKLSALRPF
jgi:hypothetical protein